MASCDLSVIVPTLREGENLQRLVPCIHKSLAGIPPTWEIVIVDDNSQDGTQEICDSLRSHHPLRLETRMNSRGLASAVILGMEVARGQTFVVMDGDLSHPPEYIPQLLDESRDGAEIALGSRYVQGGTTEDGWGLPRLVNSRVASLLARPLTSVSDPMSGFFAVPKRVVDRCQELNPIGYKIALELIVKCRCRDVREIPIAFRNRRSGVSQMSIKEQLSYLRHLQRLYCFKLRSLVGSV